MYTHIARIYWHEYLKTQQPEAIHVAPFRRKPQPIAMHSLLCTLKVFFTFLFFFEISQKIRQVVWHWLSFIGWFQNLRSVGTVQRTSCM